MVNPQQKFKQIFKSVIYELVNITFNFNTQGDLKSREKKIVGRTIYSFNKKFLLPFSRSFFRLELGMGNRADGSFCGFRVLD